jgi:hypothetical protein
MVKTVSLRVSEEEYLLLIKMSEEQNGGNLNKFIKYKLFNESEIFSQKTVKLLLEILKYSAITSKAIEEKFFQEGEDLEKLKQIKTDFKDYINKL